ncbi:hypothetical protein [Actinomadura livida]|uniref:DUF1761 domain-containing protein n=1 Tax=Actinomadura livida TaxID=79909 RepID=A0A7W7IA98_9ACTN|nr:MULTISPECIES: hypothetical protein [Actinomadura]MBB4773308.1 hypothetical protein [Actinomadura catellatispora]GGU33295.1 hypothetical protein GCM10010208_67400 [Actinomadura livida]
MIPRKAILAGVAVIFLGTVLLVAVFGFVQDPETEPGAAATAFSWVLGTIVRATGGYVAGRLSVRTGGKGRVAGAGAIAGAVAYTLFLTLMVALAVLGGDPGFSIGDVAGLLVWTAQAALGGGLAAVLHRKRIASELQTSAWAYG